MPINSDPNISFCFGKLSQNEIDTIIKEIQSTVNITGYTKEEWTNFEDIISVYYQKELAGICLNISIDESWEEIAVLLVLPSFRGKGIGKLLFQKSVQEIHSKNKKIYITSRNPIVIEMMKEESFAIVSIWQLPLAIQIFNLKFIFSFYRVKEFFRKKMYDRNLPEFLYGIK